MSGDMVFIHIIVEFVGLRGSLRRSGGGAISLRGSESGLFIPAYFSDSVLFSSKVPKSCIARITVSNSFPMAVSAYSVVGGTVGNTVRQMICLASNSLSLSLRTFGRIETSDLSNSENRFLPESRSRTISVAHLCSMISAVARTGQSTEHVVLDGSSSLMAINSVSGYQFGAFLCGFARYS